MSTKTTSFRTPDELFDTRYMYVQEEVFQGFYRPLFENGTFRWGHVFTS